MSTYVTEQCPGRDTTAVSGPINPQHSGTLVFTTSPQWCRALLYSAVEIFIERESVLVCLNLSVGVCMYVCVWASVFVCGRMCVHYPVRKTSMHTDR